MADDEKEGDNTSRTAEWEVVTLTASAYAAAPGPIDPPGETVEDLDENEDELSDAMFMSKHFIFPPPEHKTLLVEPDCSEIHSEPVSQWINPSQEQFNVPKKVDEDNWKMKSDDGLHGFQFFDKGKSLSDHGTEFGEGKALEGLTMVIKEQALFVDPALTALDAETDLHQSVLCDENADTPETDDPFHVNMECPSDCINASDPKDKNEYDVSDVPCEAWWKRQAMSMYNHAKEANTFWSVFVAAAVMGLVILGQQWQRGTLQFQRLKLHFAIGDQGFSRMLGPFGRFKDILVGGHQRSLLIRGDNASNQ